MTLVSGNIKFRLCGCSQGFSRRETSNDTGVARHACVLRSHAEILFAVCVTNLPDHRTRFRR